MALPTFKYAVYYGTIRLTSGDIVTYTAQQVATFYNVQDQPYVAVPLVGVNPIQQKEYEYIQLKPQADGQYYDAKTTYNVSGGEYLDTNFDAHRGGKWVQKPVVGDNPDADYL